MLAFKCAYHIEFIGKVHAQSKRSNVYQIRKGLERSMEPDDTRERSQPNCNGTCGEEDNECKRGECSVGNEHPPLLLDIAVATKS